MHLSSFCRVDRNSKRGLFGHNDIVIAAANLAEGAGILAPVCAGNQKNTEPFGMYVVFQADAAKGANGTEHLRGQLHFLVNIRLADSDLFFHIDLLIKWICKSTGAVRDKNTGRSRSINSPAGLLCAGLSFTRPA